MSAASIAMSVPVPSASPRSACASAGASLTPSPTIATTLPARLEPLDLAAPCRPERRRRASARSRPRRRPARARARLSPVSRTGSRPSARSSRTAWALVGLTASASVRAARGSPSHATSIASPAAGRPRPRGPSTSPSTPTPGRLRNPATGGSAPSSARAAAATARADRMLGGRLDRTGEPQHLGAGARRRAAPRRRARACPR